MSDLEDRYKEICSSQTIHSHKKGFFFEFCETIKQTVGLTYILNIFRNIDSDEKRILKMYTDNNINYNTALILYKISMIYKKKDALKSKKKRIECLHAESKEDIMILVNHLNQSVIYAPKVGECTTIDDGYTLPLACLTRADILLKQSEYVLAYEDLKNVIELNVPFLNTEKLIHKILLCRYLKGQMSLDDYKIKLCQKFIVSLQETDVKCSFMSNIMKINKSTSAGREATANYTINPGDTLVAENPIASCLLPNFYNSHCQTCLRRFKISYGCPECSAVGFCSYSCRDIGLKSYHKYECKMSSLLFGAGISILCHLALRIITQLGLHKCLEIYHNIIEDVETTDILMYLKLYNLENHFSERTDNDFFSRTLMATFLVQCLKQVNFFGATSKTLKSKKYPHVNEIIVGALILKNLQFLQFNAHEIYETIPLQSSSIYNKVSPLYIGIGIYPTAALFNHQCYAATIRYFNGKKIILKSNQLIQVNDIIAENYGPVFTKKTIIERRRYLAGRYWFNCCCQACTNDWPLLNDIKCVNVRIRCNSKFCSEFMDVEFDKNFEKIHVCQKCNAVSKFSKAHQNIIKKCILWYAHGITVMDKQYAPEAAQILLPALRIFHHIACVPNRFTHLAEITLQHCLMCS